jgi:hypothetical protein
MLADMLGPFDMEKVQRGARLRRSPEKQIPKS